MPAIMVIVFWGEFRMWFWTIGDYMPETPQLLDYMMLLLGGMRKYIPDPENAFLFPVQWIILHLLVANVVLYYPLRDLSGFGTHILLRSNGRTRWWMSKVCWVVLNVLLAYAVVWLLMLLLCLVAGVPFSGIVTAELVEQRFELEESFELGESLGAFSAAIGLKMLVLPALVSSGICLLQMTLGLLIKPLYSFIGTIIILLAFAYCATPFLPGNYMMPVRSDEVVVGGLTSFGGVAWGIGLIVVFIIVGCIRFHRYDIINLEE